MNFTFGIITNENKYDFLTQIVRDIANLSIPNFEIIIIGGNSKIENTKHIIFDESIKNNWITRKKNIITQEAKFDNIVYLHDYITFDKDWYKNFIIFGNDFDICMNSILNLDGNRFRDWCLWPGDKRWELENGHYENIQVRDIINKYLLPYSIQDLSNYMYFSGSYWVAKKRVMLEYPLNENMIWNQGEDVDWSLRVRKKYKFSINENSKVRLLKLKDRIYDLASESDLLKLKKYINNI